MKQAFFPPYIRGTGQSKHVCHRLPAFLPITPTLGSRTLASGSRKCSQTAGSTSQYPSSTQQESQGLLSGGGGAAAPQLQSPHYHDYHHHQRTLRHTPALLTGRRVRRPPPRSRCLAPGSCHRGPPEPAAPPPQRGSSRGDTRQGPGFPARPRGPASHTLKPWPA